VKQSAQDYVGTKTIALSNSQMLPAETVLFSKTRLNATQARNKHVFHFKKPLLFAERHLQFYRAQSI